MANRIVKLASCQLHDLFILLLLVLRCQESFLFCPTVACAPKWKKRMNGGRKRRMSGDRGEERERSGWRGCPEA